MTKLDPNKLLPEQCSVAERGAVLTAPILCLTVVVQGVASNCHSQYGSGSQRPTIAELNAALVRKFMSKPSARSSAVSQVTVVKQCQVDP
jgi:hypothetical protein